MNNMKIIILGAMGMLGRELVEVFKDYHPIAWDIVNLDITNQQQVLEKITAEKPDIVINAAAYTDVNCCEKQEALAQKINGEAVGYIAEACEQVGAVMVHYSTDYVFDGAKKTGYMESDIPNPINAYGRTKLLGEKLLQQNCSKFYLVRTAWIFGRFGPKNFVQKMIKLAKLKLSYSPLKKFFYLLAGKMKIKVVNDSFGKPTYALDLAAATREIIDGHLPYGIYHLTNETPDGGISWYEFAAKAIALSGIDIKIVPCRSEDFPQPARRPQYSALLNTKLPKMRDWKSALEEYLKK